MTKAVPSGDQVGTVFVPKPNSVIGGKPQYNNHTSKLKRQDSKLNVIVISWVVCVNCVVNPNI